LDRAAEHVLEVEMLCDGYESRARVAENRYRDAVRTLRDLKDSQHMTSPSLDQFLQTESARNARLESELKIDTSRLKRSETSRLAHTDAPLSAVSSSSTGSYKSEPTKKAELYDTISPPLTATITREALVSRILEGEINVVMVGE
jgi:WNK lysine deficient protein kinase